MIIGARGAQALADAIRAGDLRNLHTLNLYDNFIEVQGAQALAAAIEAGHLPNLHTLNLRDPIIDNRLEVGAAQTLALDIVCRRIAALLEVSEPRRLDNICLLTAC